MNMDADNLYLAMKTRDARFDGRFFVGVSSTGIYCRPVCTVRAPKRENCTFYQSAAAAENAGYRPCMRCRPELAPGQASVDAPRRLAQAAVRLIEDGALTDASLGELAGRLGVSDRHLRRVFQSELGVAPVEYAQTQRLLLSKRLLTDTELSVTDVAMVSGFNSLRRFNALFKERYRMQPSQLRKGKRPSATGDVLTFELGYRPPYDWDGMLRFLAGRAIPEIEVVEAGEYRRCVRLRAPDGKICDGWITVTHVPDHRALRIRLSDTLTRVIPLVLARVRALFDLSCVPSEVEDRLGKLAAKAPGLRVPGAFDGFEMAVRAILGQQVTVSGARTLCGRVVAAFGAEVATPLKGLTRVFPTPAVVAATPVETLAELGIIRTRAEAIRQLADRLARGQLRLDPSADVDATLATLEAIPGVGPWTAQYVAMRALAWPDAFLPTDLGVKKALGGSTPTVAKQKAEAWRPWRSYAVMHLWRTLEKETT